jgi:hypothetical protein
MSFLRRLLGGGDDAERPEPNGTNEKGSTPPVDADEAERLHERELLMAENERLDELKRRQLKYADKAWTPPAQGGERRADDEDAAADS